MLFNLGLFLVFFPTPANKAMPCTRFKCLEKWKGIFCLAYGKKHLYFYDLKNKCKCFDLNI